MSTTIGVELSLDTVRAIAPGALRAAPRTFECAWDPERPLDAVRQLRAEFGAVNRIALSIGLAFLHVKNVKLPPAPPLERKRMLALEPDRFFPVQDQPVVVALDDRENIAFAIDEAMLGRWIAAFATWAPVEVVEPAASSVARVLNSGSKGTFALPAGAGEQGIVEVDDGTLRGVRRIPQGAEAVSARTIPEIKGVPGEFLAAFGASRGVSEGLEGMLMPAALQAQVRRARVRRFGFAVLLCVVGLGLAVWSVGHSRERKLAAIRAELAALTPRAQGARQLSDQLAALNRESAVLGALSKRIDPIEVLAALSAQLPKGATVLNLKVNGADWQIDGTANDAAALLPLLDSSERIENVRFVSASTRFRDGNRTVETFSIAFRVRPGD